MIKRIKRVINWLLTGNKWGLKQKDFDVEITPIRRQSIGEMSKISSHYSRENHPDILCYNEWMEFSQKLIGEDFAPKPYCGVILRWIGGPVAKAIQEDDKKYPAIPLNDKADYQKALQVLKEESRYYFDLSQPSK